ncbi:MAG: flippase-like domain-containing protein [Ignavibacteria bacterium]|nr:flippase-like domain-containing protein [Ignavibacteria bacterium]
MNFKSIPLFLSANQKIKKIGLPLLKVIVGLGLLIYFVQKISFRELITSIYSINFFLFFIAIILSLLNIYIQQIRWKSLVKNENQSIDNKTIFKSLLIGFSAGTFTPARSGEYFLRKLPLSQISLTSTITLTFIDKMMLLVNVIFWGALVSFGMMIFYYEVDLYVTASLFILFITFFTAFFMIIYSRRFYNYLKEIKQRYNIKFKFLKKLIEPLSELSNQLISKLLMLAFLNYVVIVLEFAVIVLSFGVDINFAQLLVAAMMVYFSKTLIPSITFGEIGIREGAAIYFFGIFGCAEAVAFNSSMFLFILNLLLPSLVGLFFLISLKRAE